MDPDHKLHRIKINGKKIIKKINSQNLLKHVWNVLSNTVLVALFNLAFHLITSRKLGPEQYGELQTLNTINGILLIALAAVAFVVTKFVAYYKTRQQYDKMKYLAQWAFIFFFLIGATAFIITVMMSKIIAKFLNIADYTILVIFGLFIWINFLIPIIDGILRGLQEFKLIGRYKLLEAFLRVLIGAVIVYLGFGTKTVVGGLVVSGALTVLVAGYLIKRIYINKPYKIPLKEIYKFALPVFISCTLFAILANIDVVLVRHFFDAKTTGYFGAASMISKIVLGLAFGSAGVMFPKIVENNSNGKLKEMVQTFKNTLKIILIVGVILTALIAIFPVQTSHMFFGKQYEIDYMLSIYAIATLFLSFVAILMMYDLTVKRYSFIPVLIAASIIEIYQIFRLHETIYNIVWTLFTINLMVLIFMIIYNRKVLVEQIS